MLGLDWIATILGWIGALCLGLAPYMRPWGWLLYALASAIWIYVGLKAGLAGLAMSSIGYVILELFNFLKALKEKA